MFGFLFVQVMQEEFSETVLHRNRAAASQPAEAKAGAVNTPGRPIDSQLSTHFVRFLGRKQLYIVRSKRQQHGSRERAC